ncbi:winged helix-turn-helix transcriptional regulator [Actinomycetospora flava]|uniref:Helix-turn-helix domain-containing protein n=1 Tax=Actinomycetospora flava TaxID=3129232 RepID=A0ABU8LXM0_9PSEU
MCSREPVPPEVRALTALLERRWSLSVLYAAHLGAVRFSEFEQALGQVPPATLAARLADLEEAGLIERRVLDTRPPRTEYGLSAEGRRLAPLLEALTACSRERRPR